MPSRREMIRMDEAEIAEFLGGRRTLQLASIGPSGDVHLVAMWYGFLDASNVFDRSLGYTPDNLVIETFAKSQKVQNFRRRPRFTALVEAGEQYNVLAGVELVGSVEIIEDEAAVIESCKAVLSRYEHFDKPEDLQFAAEMAARKRVGLRFHVEKTVSWNHAKLDVQY